MSAQVWQVVGNGIMPATIPLERASALAELDQLRAENPDVEFFVA